MSRRHSVRPVVVEVRPDNAPPVDNAPSSPSSPSSPKAVRFSPTLDLASRPLTTTEAWSLYHFENHARQCPQCYQPAEVYRRGETLCDAGRGLAHDVAYHVFHKDGDVYSTKKDDSKLVRVEIPHDYKQLRSLLKAMDRGIRTHRTVPIVSYDRSYPIPARRSYEPSGEPETVIIEPASSTDYQSRRRSKKSAGYATVVINEDVTATTPVRSALPSAAVPKKDQQRRGSLYEPRKEKKYRVEIREPSERKERRRGGEQQQQSSDVYL